MFATAHKPENFKALFVGTGGCASLSNYIYYDLSQNPDPCEQLSESSCYMKLPDGSGSIITKDNCGINGSGSVITKDSYEFFSYLFSSKEKSVAKSTMTTIASTKDQIEDLRWHMGLNISEIASILRVKRPTVYEWLEEKTRRPRKQKRLEKIHTFCKTWKKFGVGRIGSYLYKVLDGNKNLFNLLNDDVLDEALIVKALSRIKDNLIRIQNEKKQREEVLKKDGFVPTPVEREEIKKWIDRTMRKIG